MDSVFLHLYLYIYKFNVTLTEIRRMIESQPDVIIVNKVWWGLQTTPLTNADNNAVQGFKLFFPSAVTEYITGCVAVRRKNGWHTWNEKLIILVEQHPKLYDHQLKSYCDIARKVDISQAISAELGGIQGTLNKTRWIFCYISLASYLVNVSLLNWFR